MENYRIMLADDHVLVRQGLGGLLNGENGLEVVGEAGDGFELLALLKSLTPHLVILDISMPYLRGIEVILAVKAKYPEIKILVLTMHKEYLHQAISSGADGYLLKEDADRDLFSAIENIRQERVYISSRLTGNLPEAQLARCELLSPREMEVFKLIACGKTNKESAETLSISVRTVESHRAAILDKLELKNTADLVKHALQKGYI
jgi:DNA-binding NarL/FixJ family response regulator